MSKISGKNTKPEILVRSILHKNGFRFRLHSNKLPGKPDIFLSKHSTAIFVHGCYWHRHPNCKKGCSFPSTHKDFWATKFANTLLRDKENIKRLKALGFKVIIVWECELKDIPKLSSRLKAEIHKPLPT